MTSFVGTSGHQAPEILQYQPYTPAVDIWSVGCILFRLWSGKTLFPSPAELFEYVYQPGGSKTQNLKKTLLEQGIESGAAPDLVTKLLQINPEARPSAEAALSHVWLNNLSGVETQKITQELYDHFVEVLSRGVLQRFINVPPAEDPSDGETISFIYLLW